MEKTKKISIISAIIALVFVSGLLVLSHGQTLAYVRGEPGVQTADGDGENDPCANPSSPDKDSAQNKACGGGGGGGTTTPTTTNYTLNTSVTSGSETGSITWSPWSFLDGCNSTCSTPIPSGTYETFTATPAIGYEFKGWGGDCASYGTGTCYLTMNSNKSVSASFSFSPELINKSTVVVYVTDDVTEPSGIITAEDEICSIQDGSNTCNIRFDWQTNNPIGTSAVTRSPASGFIVQNANTGEGVSLPVVHGDSTFYLYNNEKELSNVLVKADCASGTSWISSQNKCIKDVSVKKFSTSNCIIPEGGSSCNANISWEVSGGTGNFAVTTPNNITVASGKSGNATYGVEYPSRNFYLYNDGNELANGRSYADCVEGTAWSMGEKKCVSVLPPEPPIIEPACPPGTTWDELQKKCVAMGHDCPLGTTWNETQKTCLCDNGATNPPLCTIFPPQECTNGASNPPECNLFGTLSKFEVKDCSIKSNESSCQTKLNWASTLLGSFAITTPEQITVSTASSDTDVPYTVEYPSRKFFAYNNGNLIEEKVAYAKCEEGNIWSMTDNKCVSEMLCAGELERDIYFDCPVGYEGKIIRKQFKTFPGCIFEDPATEENTVLINNNCRSKDDPDPQWRERRCNECSEGVEQVYCTETNENGDVREFIMNCPGDVGGGGSGQSVLNIEIKATPEKIMKGRLSTITWSSNADSCRAIPVPGYLNDFNTGEGNRPNGFDTVKPLSNNLYKIECTKGEITESKMIEVKVSSLNIIEL